MIEIRPTGPIHATLKVPGSKSITQRALIAAALAQGESRLIGPLVSEDTEYTSQALRAFGVNISQNDGYWLVEGRGGVINPPAKPIYLGNNGTATRFLASVVTLGKGNFVIDGDERMRQRPISPLLSALHGWGANIQSLHNDGCPPLTAQSSGIAGGHTVLPEGKSSQYLSSLLLVAPYANDVATLSVEGKLLSRPYVEMTLAVMHDFGVTVECAKDFSWFSVPRGCYHGKTYQIEGDASSASYFWAAAAITGGEIQVSNVPVPSLQGDAMLVPLLARMGCEVTQKESGFSLSCRRPLEGIEVDMKDMPDVAPTLAVVAAFAQGDTVIRNIGHLRIKECDRLDAVATELSRIGARVDELDDALIIHGDGGSSLHGAEISTYNDHRMAMAFAVAGLRVPGIRITGEDCVKKSFPDFWKRFQSIY